MGKEIVFVCCMAIMLAVIALFWVLKREKDKKDKGGEDRRS